MFTIYSDQYQILDDVEIPVNGLTFLVGSAHNGKSSVIRSVYGALYNQTGEDFIQDGKGQTDVELSFKDLEIHWQKERGSGATYEINGEKFSKVGRGNFSELMEKGFRPIQAGPEEFELQFWMQMEPFLICNRPNTRKFEILSNIFEADRFDDVLDSMKSDKKELDQDIDKKETQISILDEDIEELEKERLVYSEFFEEHESLMQEIVEKKERLDKLEGLSISYESVQNSIENLNKDINEIETVLDTVDLDSAENKIETLGSLQEYEEISETLYNIEQAESEFTGIDLADIDDDINTLSLIAEYKEKQYFIEQFDSVNFDLSFDYGAIEDKINTLSLLLEHHHYDEKCSSFKKDIESKETKLDQIHNELESVKEELEVCPVCEQSF